jgi:hypothetical protein
LFFLVVEIQRNWIAGSLCIRRRPEIGCKNLPTIQRAGNASKKILI